jgi:glycosyltransferase involved in cell wall biosynthesis
MNKNAAILFEADGYLLNNAKLMGRHSAGNGFLRAAIAGCQNETLYGYTPFAKSAEVFTQVVKAANPNLQTSWIPADRLDLLTEVGTLYLPGPGLDEASRLRLRAGCNAYSLVGVTHTTASHGAMESIVNLLSAPVMPWDALICTSKAVVDSVKVMLEAELEYLHWRFGQSLKVTFPQLPIIPLGVHCDDFYFTPQQKQASRQRLAIMEDEIVVLFVGRLSFHAKAHPHAMYLGLQAAAEKTGKKITLVQSGWFANEFIENGFKDGAKQFCPDVRAIFVDGRGEQARFNWAAADIFISLSDNIQETFGITPVEAMAAGLPVVVTDWDGYKDTIRDGIDGFRIPTWMPPPSAGESFARAYEAKMDNYDMYCGINCQTVSVDVQVLTDRLCDLVLQPELRAQMGQAGLQRARELFNWSGIYRQYQDLYQELSQMRKFAPKLGWQAVIANTPKMSAARLDPYKVFGHYPTGLITQTTQVSLTNRADLQDYPALVNHNLFNYAVKELPSLSVVEKIIQALTERVLSVQDLGVKIALSFADTVLALSFLAKIGFVRFYTLASE